MKKGNGGSTELGFWSAFPLVGLSDRYSFKICGMVMGARSFSFKSERAIFVLFLSFVLLEVSCVNIDGKRDRFIYIYIQEGQRKASSAAFVSPDIKNPAEPRI